MKEAWHLLHRNRVGENLNLFDFRELVESIGYSNNQSDWYALLRYACTVTPSETISIDEMAF